MFFFLFLGTIISAFLIDIIKKTKIKPKVFLKHDRDLMFMLLSCLRYMQLTDCHSFTQQHMV